MKNQYHEQRDLLIQQKEEFKQAIMDDVQETKKELSDKTQLVLVGVGALLLGYLAVKLVDELVDSKPGKKTKPSPDQLASAQPPTYQAPPPAASEFSLLRTLKEQIALVVISVIKDKLYDFIEQFGQPKPAKKGGDED
jgi:hypothetical protein